MVWLELRRLMADILDLPEADIAPGRALFRKGGMTRLDMAKLLLWSEKAFHVTIHDEDALEMSYARDLAAYLEEQQKDGRDGAAPPSDSEREAWYYE